MDRSPHEYSYAQQQQRQAAAVQQQQPQQFAYHPQHQQFQPSPPPFIPPHPPIPQFSYPHHLPPQQQPSPSLLHPHLPHPQALHQQPPPPSFPHIIPPPFPQYETPPNDSELQKRIDKLVEYSVKNGPEFEAMIREKQQNNPDYSFLFGGEGHGYYRYKLWISTRPPGSPFNQPFPSSSLAMMHPPLSPLIPSPVGASGAVGNAMIMHQLPFQAFYDPHNPPPLFGPNGRPPFDVVSLPVNPPSLPPDVAIELNNVILGLNGTKESIKGAKNWFMQRSQFAPSLAEALKSRVFTWDDSEKQLHIIYLVNDILFDGLQRRVNIKELDIDAVAFKSVIGAMLARIYHNPIKKEENQTRLQKIIRFWGSKEVYDQETIRAIEAEMMGSLSEASSSDSGFVSQAMTQTPLLWQPERQAASDPEHSENRAFIPPSFPPTNEKAPPFPLFPPGLIPGMVRKMQIGSGVPYSSLSPLDIPSVIPPSEMSQTEIVERVLRFFKEIGESGTSEAGFHSRDDYESYETPVRKGGACIPPPPNLQVDPESGTYADGSVERKNGSGSGRLGLGATADPNEPSQYDDVYTSYRKHRSTTYHSSMSARAAPR